jgi:beta-glucosidase
MAFVSHLKAALPVLFATALAAQTPAYLNPGLPIPQRVDDLVSRMTLEQKVSQMQNAAPAIPSLHIAAYDWWNEGLHGVARSGYATVFPQAIGMAATWDTGLIHQVADTISTEARAKYNHAQRQGNTSIYFGLTFWSPNINIYRDPRWGRGQETYGEDPFLTGRIGTAFVQGMQGDDPHYLKVVATAKHYAVHSGPEPERHTFNVEVSPHDLNDTYLPAFRALVVDAHVDSLMCAYNAIDGAPACASKMLLQKTLYGDWHFNGYVVSDCAAITDVYKGHKFAPDAAHAAAVSVKAGTDLSCGHEYAALVDAVHQGLIAQGEIDAAVKRLFTARFRLGMFDPADAVPFNRIPFSEDDSKAHAELALPARKPSRSSDPTPMRSPRWRATTTPSLRTRSRRWKPCSSACPATSSTRRVRLTWTAHPFPCLRPSSPPTPAATRRPACSANTSAAISPASRWCSASIATSTSTGTPHPPRPASPQRSSPRAGPAC